MTPPVRSRLVFLLVSVMLVFGLIGGGMMSARASEKEADADSIYKYLSLFTDTLNLVRQAYVEETDVRQMMRDAMDATTDALDPFSVFIPASDAQAYAETNAIGASRSGLRIAHEHGIASVLGVGEGSPAKTAGFEFGDMIAKVGGETTHQWTLLQLERAFTGAPGTKIDVELIHLGEPRKVTIELALWHPPAPRLESLRDGAVSVRIAEITATTPADLEAVLRGREASASRKLLLDLRGTTGEDSEAAYATAALFSRGDLGVLLGKKAAVTKTFRYDKDPTWKGDLVVLVDRATLGPGEVLATVLRQSAGARLVGSSTFGYAGHLTVVDVAQGSRLRITDGFYTAADKQRLKEGLEPDLEVDERARMFAEKDKPLTELVRERGLRLLLGEEALPPKKAAA